MMVLYMAFSLLMRPSAVETHILSHDSFLALDQAGAAKACVLGKTGLRDFPLAESDSPG
ncbi:MAG: hypothetical protein M9945_11920 [Aquamicrobium sp.]|uniref:hypothetical protein n=1 Tax=Aquamicrobium sp. TaxID=1872579 RepID=UPI00349E5AD7|nr:hypothetical protein [Aquamicrobium sp.]